MGSLDGKNDRIQVHPSPKLKTIFVLKAKLSFSFKSKTIDDTSQ